MFVMEMSPKKRFEKAVKKTKSCWLWKQCKDRWGYGHFKLGKKTCQAHRVSYFFYVGNIPKGMCVLHNCDNPACVNPKHLFIGTNLDNVRDRERKGRGDSGRGEDSGSARLTNKQVLEIRKRYIPYQLSSEKLAKEYGVKKRAIQKVILRRTWKHI